MSVCAATVSAAAGSHGAGAAASAIGSYVRRVTESHAARLRNMLCVAEEEDEVRCLLAGNSHICT